MTETSKPSNRNSVNGSNHSNNKIFCLMGPSSSGKDKIYKALIADETLPVREVVLYTTRPIRTGEQDGREYHFVTEDQYRATEEAGKIIEVRTYNTAFGPWRYYTADDGQIDLSRASSLMIGTVEACCHIRDHFGAEAVEPFYIHVDDGERLARALKRERKQENPRYTEMCRRFIADEADFAPDELEKCGITAKNTFENTEGALDECVREIREAILTECRS
ncbi:MAG: guanylate kinase [Lachnospiraceae bacterium]|nr:guanylate kinase [Lachnospiraceae bacterium]MDD4526049.1 guanylate kinase [Lachnospiraceae bacterium]